MALNRDYMCAQKRAKYVLAEPKPDVKDMYVKDFQRQLLADAEAFIEFIQFILYMCRWHILPHSSIQLLHVFYTTWLYEDSIYSETSLQYIDHFISSLRGNQFTLENVVDCP